jgi:LPS-assembly lipoprotein
VDVANIPERTGQMLRLSLETKLHGAGAPAQQLYSLTVGYSLGTAQIGEQEDTSYTRERFNGLATWVLTPIGQPGVRLAGGTATTQDALNIIDQQYFALTTETETIDQQVADELADEITEQIAAYFKTHPSA